MIKQILLLIVVNCIARSTAELTKLANVTKLVNPLKTEVISCRAGFYNYQGWCVSTTSPTQYNYQDSVNYCASLGAFAPSIHSKADIDFWGGFAKTLYATHFWLDAYCPSTGALYVWMDGTETDYVGGNLELKNCALSYGVHMEYFGFSRSSNNELAPAVCAYNPSLQPVATTPAVPEPAGLEDNCNPSSIYLDIVFVVDTSAGMARDTVTEATTTIQSTLYGLSLGTERFQSNVAAIAFADTVQIVRDFGDFNSTKDISSFSLPYLGGKAAKMTDAINQASSMISSNARNFTRGVIVLLTNSFEESNSLSIMNATDTFKDDGGIFISIDYSMAGVEGLEIITSPGFYLFNNSTANQTLDTGLLYAFCDANTFCKDHQIAYSLQNSRGRVLPDGCYVLPGIPAVYDTAKDSCEGLGGFVATVHDGDTGFFMTSLFPPKSPYWIGLQWNGTMYEWADGVNDSWNYWTSSPIAGQDCVYSQQTTGFNTQWFNAACDDPLKYSLQYACQQRPCSSEYDCWS